MSEINKTFLVSVGDYIAVDPDSDSVLFSGNFLTESTFTLEMSETEARGGSGNSLGYLFKHSRNLRLSLMQNIFEKDFLATNVGSSIVNSAVDVWKTECIQLTAGAGTVTETPVGNVSVKLGNGTIQTVTPTGSNITVGGAGTETATVYYQYNDTVDTVTINATETPTVVKLILTAKVKASNGNTTELWQAEIPRFQIDGNYELSLTADGISSEMLEGRALAIQTTDNCDGQIYGTARWIPQAGVAVAYTALATTPATFEPAVGSLPATQQLTVLGIRGGNYVNVNLTADSNTSYAMEAGSDADITVDANGLITVAGTAVATDTGTVKITYDDGTNPAIEDVVVVTVQS